jgi:putative PIN family toxin of toxin-antitoxin system
MQPLVLDTNIVLDLLVFEDAQALDVKTGLEQGTLRWLATLPMRDELERVLAYPQIASRLASRALRADHVLKAFDGRAVLVEVPGKAPVSCSDADDQKFIDLAVRHKCWLLSKDAAVLSMKKRLAALGVAAFPAIAGLLLQPHRP